MPNPFISLLYGFQNDSNLFISRVINFFREYHCDLFNIRFLTAKPSAAKRITEYIFQTFWLPHFDLLQDDFFTDENALRMYDLVLSLLLLLAR